MKCLLLSTFLFVTVYGGILQNNDFQSIIEIVNSRGATWRAGHNFNPDTELSSIKRLLGAKKSPVKLPPREKLLTNMVIPEQFDAREHWPNCPTLRQVRDQGNCGSCWAVAAASAFSDRFCIATNGSFTQPLSEEELLSCCQTCGMGCDGGYPLAAWSYFATQGIVTGGGYNSNIGCQPYEIQDCEHHSSGRRPSCDSLPVMDTPPCRRKCTNPSYSRSFSEDHHKVKRAYSLDSVTEIQKEIMLHGPVEASFEVYGDFPTYKSGVYHYVTGSLLGGHAVRVIGWGVEEGIPYWLVANSWNEDWGDKGLFKILRGRNECGFEEDMVAGLPKV